MIANVFHYTTTIIYYAVIYFVYYLFGSLLARAWLWLRALFLLMLLGYIFKASEDIHFYSSDYFLNIAVPFLAFAFPSIRRTFFDDSLSFDLPFGRIIDWIQDAAYRFREVRPKKTKPRFEPGATKEQQTRPGQAKQAKSQERLNQGQKEKSRDTPPPKSPRGDFESKLDRAYKTLGVERGTPYEQIRARFLELRRDYDPMRYDRQPEWIRKQAHEKAIELQEAWEVIKESLGKS